MPSQQGLRGDDQAQAGKLGAGQQPGQGGQNRPVGPRQPQRLGLPLEHGDSAAQDEDRGVLGPVGAGQQSEPAGRPENRQASKS